MKYYKQVKSVNWLNTPKDTIWIEFANLKNGYYIQPEDETLRDTPLGVNLSILDDDHILLFEEINTISI